MKHLFWTIILFAPAIALGAEKNGTATGIEWEIVIKAIGALIGAIVAYTQIKSTHPISRATLKADLEILKLIDKSDSNYKLIKDNFDSRIRHLYGSRTKYTSWPTVIFGALWASGFAYWTFYIVKDGFSWWSLLTGYLAIGGLGWVMMGFRGGFLQRRTQEESSKRRKAEVEQ